MANFDLSVDSLSHVGMKRDNNEDAVASIAAKGIAILADGMGGYKAGEVASAIAVATLLEQLEQAADNSPTASPRDVIAAAVDMANHAIFSSAQDNQKYKNMGTTLVVFWLNNGTIHYAHVGDSRLYRLRGSVIEQITRDHSLVNELIEKGFYTEEEAEHADNKNVITRAMGVKATVEADINHTDAVDGDIYLMCSDGLSDLVSDDTIADILNEHRDTPHNACTALVDLANNNGGKDNVSVMVAKVSEQQPAPPSKIMSALNWLFKH